MRLTAILGPCAPLFPLRLWTYASENQPDGNFADYSPDEIASICSCSSNAQAMLDALHHAGFLDSNGFLHDWDEHNGFHTSMADKARRAALVRWKKVPPTPPLNIKNTKGKERREHCPSNAQASDDKIPLYFQAFQKAFKAQFGETYIAQKQDLPRLERFISDRADVLPERLVQVAKGNWELGQFCPGSAKSLWGLCECWSRLVATLQGQTHGISGAASPVPGKYSKMGENNDK